MTNFTKSDFAEQLSTKLGVSKAVAIHTIESVVDVIIDATSNSKAVCFGKLGKFKVVTRKARKAKNPQNGQVINVPEKQVLTFKRSSTL